MHGPLKWTWWLSIFYPFLAIKVDLNFHGKFKKKLYVRISFKYLLVSWIFKMHSNAKYFSIGRFRFLLTGRYICGAIILTISYSNQNYEENQWPHYFHHISKLKQIVRVSRCTNTACKWTNNQLFIGHWIKRSVRCEDRPLTKAPCKVISLILYIISIKLPKSSHYFCISNDIERIYTDSRTTVVEMYMFCIVGLHQGLTTGIKNIWKWADIRLK